MRAALPGFHALMTLVLAFSACRAPEAATPVGVSTAVPDREAAKKPEALRRVWPDFEVARSWPEAAPPRRALAHRRDGTLVHVRVEPPGLEAYLALSEEAPMPDGARVVAWHESPAGELLGGYLLEKVGGAWQGRELDARGALLPGDGAACIRCHDMAPIDHLFGLPRSAASTPRPAPTPRNGESTAPSGR